MPFQLSTVKAPTLSPEPAEADFSSLAGRLREGEGRASDTDRAAREALQRFAQTEAQLRSTEVVMCSCHVTHMGLF